MSLLKLEKINTIIWDWNGTLLNDIDICIQSINQLLATRNLPILEKEYYLNVFGFPVKDYYQRIGFDFSKEPFEIPANEFIELYSANLTQAILHPSVSEILHHYKEKGYLQLVLSASEQNKLTEALEYFGIDSYFEMAVGLDHDFATSKIDLGIEMLKKLAISPKTVCLVGDTTHDYSVAKALGCECILIANGHQNRRKLEKTEATILDNLNDLLTLI